MLSNTLKIVLALPVIVYVLQYLSQPTYPVHEHGGILVTGASTGIGRHAALSLAGRGYTVYAGVRKQSDAASLNGEGLGDRLRPIILDVTKTEQIAAAVTEIQASLGNEPFIALVNNAGVDGHDVVELMDLEAARWTFDVNFFGVIEVTQRFLPLLRAAGRGARIVHVGSISGFIANPGGAPYCSSKFALEAINDQMRVELAPWGISSSIVNAGIVKTAITGKFMAAKAASLERYTEELRSLYSHILNEAQDRQLKEFAALGSPQQVATDAITDAITSPRPQIRYFVANVGGAPAWIFATAKLWMQALSLERIMDRITLATMGIEI